MNITTDKRIRIDITDIVNYFDLNQEIIAVYIREMDEGKRVGGVKETIS